LTCTVCGSSNPQENRFCGSCGASFDFALQRIREDLSSHIAEQIATVTAGWKEQKLLDIETTEVIVDRLQKWAKLFAFFTAVPLALIALWLGLLGYSSYKDFRAKVDQTTKDVDTKVQQAATGVAALGQQEAHLTDAQQDLSRKQGELSKAQTELAPQLTVARTRVESLQRMEGDLSGSQLKISENLRSLRPELEGAQRTVNDLKNKTSDMTSTENQIRDAQSALLEKTNAAKDQVRQLDDRAATLKESMEADGQIVSRLDALNKTVGTARKRFGSQGRTRTRNRLVDGSYSRC